MSFRSGRHFLQIPGPTNVPDRVLGAMDRPTVDHRGPAFADFARELLDSLRWVFQSSGPVIVYPASGSGGWEAALANVLSPGDKVLMFDHGFFATQWHQVATRIGVEAQLVPGDWHRGVSAEAVEAALRDDGGSAIKAVCVVHNETSTGVTTSLTDIRSALDQVGHSALLMVDAVSSLGAIELRQEEWGIDVVVAGSQKGLMLPPGLSFNALSQKALDRCSSARLPRSYWDWSEMLKYNESGFFPYSPATNLLFGLREALTMLREEGLEHVYARHRRHGEATRTAVKTWGLENYAVNPDEFSSVVTAVTMPLEVDADAVRKVILDRFDMSLGAGLGKLRGRLFRIGHLGDFNDLTLAGTLAGVEMGLQIAGVPCDDGGIGAALELLRETTPADFIREPLTAALGS